MSFSKATFLLPLFLFACERPQEPENNFVEIRPLRVDTKAWTNVPDKLTFSLVVKSEGSKGLSSQEFSLPTKVVPEPSTLPAWWAPYPQLERLALGTGKPLRLSVYSKDAGSAQYLFFAGEMASHDLDIDFIPFSKPVLYVIQDNPTQTRSFNDATGAKLVFALQRRVRTLPSRDIPLAGTYRTVAEGWWVKEDTTYLTYREQLGLLKSAMQIVYAQEISANPKFLNEFNLETGVRKRDLEKIKARIEKYVAQKTRQQLKRFVLTTIEANRQQELDTSKLGMYWDYYSSENKSTFFTQLLAKAFVAKAQGLGERAMGTKIGGKFGAFLEREIEQDYRELEAMQVDVIETLREARTAE